MVRNEKSEDEGDVQSDLFRPDFAEFFGGHIGAVLESVVKLVPLSLSHHRVGLPRLKFARSYG